MIFFSSDTSWDQICVSIIGATNDVLVAWENSTLSSNDVKRILDSMRSSMFCLPICAAAWLCSYMQVSIRSCTNLKKKGKNILLQKFKTLIKIGIASRRFTQTTKYGSAIFKHNSYN